MTKVEIIDDIYHATGLRKQDVQVVVDSFFAEMKEYMKNGDNIYIRGFGTFQIATRAPKTARNISKGEAIKLPARKVVKFKPAKVLSDLIMDERK